MKGASYIVDFIWQLISGQASEDSLRVPMPAAAVAPRISESRFVVELQRTTAGVPAAIEPAASVTVIAVAALILRCGAGRLKTLFRF